MSFRDLHPALPDWMTTLEARFDALFAGEHAILSNAGLGVLGTRGKRLRPAMLLLACDCVGEVSEAALRGAMMVEMIHAASLVHDDIVDEADSRRGAPSARARWGNKFSVLLGDYLFARVFELSTADGNSAVLHLLATTALEMGRAVILELSTLKPEAGEEAYWQVVQGKTASLFAASTAIGGILGGATPEQQEALRRLGEAFGYAFQLSDDLMDLQGREEEIGKPLSVDWQQRRATLPLLYAIQHAPAAQAREMQALWQTEPFTVEQITALRCLVEAAGGFDYAWNKVKEYREQAHQCLEAIPDSAGRQALARLCQDAFPLPMLPSAR